MLDAIPMPILKKYLDHFYVRNLTNNPVSIGDLSLLSIPANKRVDLLTVPLITKEKINQSFDLQEAIRQKRLVIEKEKCRKKKKTKSERQATISDEEIDLCDLADVNISGLSDDDLLQYNINTGKWENIPPEDIEGPDVNVTTVTVDYLASCDDDDVILVDATKSDVTISLPNTNSCEGKLFHIKKIDDTENRVIVDPYNDEEIDGCTVYYISNQYDCMDVVSANSWHIV